LIYGQASFPYKQRRKPAPPLYETICIFGDGISIEGDFLIDISKVDVKAPLKIIVGASSQTYSGWIQTQENELNLLKREDWEQSFRDRGIDVILSEHVWDYLLWKE
jgi:hypothetical protein